MNNEGDDYASAARRFYEPLTCGTRALVGKRRQQPPCAGLKFP